MPKRNHDTADDKGSDSDVSLVNVDFEFFDPTPSDFVALKRLLTQLLQSDAELIQVHNLSELILSQPLLGTTVKTDGQASDPYAILTVLNIHVHQEHPSIKALINYVLQKSSGSDAGVHAVLQSLLGTQGLTSQVEHVGFIVSERLINMPVQVVPHMYRMLADEIKWAIDEKEPYQFSHFLVISRLYRLTPDDENAMEGVESMSPTKRQKKRKLMTTPLSHTAGGTYSYHPEDECLQKFASHSIDYDFTNRKPRDRDSFGVETAGRLMLIPAAQLPVIVKELEQTYATLS